MQLFTTHVPTIICPTNVVLFRMFHEFHSNNDDVHVTLARLLWQDRKVPTTAKRANHMLSNTQEYTTCSSHSVCVCVCVCQPTPVRAHGVTD
jgi:hypothetical protein